MSIKQIAIAIDQLGNTLIGGTADETISARSYRLGLLRGSMFWTIIMNVIDFLFGSGHCEQSYINERDRHGQPREYK